MGALSLRDANLVIADLLDHRSHHLRTLRNGARHREILAGLRVELEAALAPPPPVEGASVAELVARHRSTMAALGAALRATQLNVLAPDEVRAAAVRVFDVFVRGRRGMGQSAGDRVRHTDRATRLRPMFAADFAMLPLDAAALLDLAIETGWALSVALGARSNRVDEGGRSNRELVRAVSRALAHLRRDIRSERALYEDLPTDLEARILGYADALAPRPRRASTTPAVAASSATEADSPPVAALVSAGDAARVPAPSLEADAARIDHPQGVEPSGPRDPSSSSSRERATRPERRSFGCTSDLVVVRIRGTRGQAPPLGLHALGDGGVGSPVRARGGVGLLAAPSEARLSR